MLNGLSAFFPLYLQATPINFRNISMKKNIIFWYFIFQAVLDPPIDNKMNWNEYFILFGRTIKMKSAILYPYGPLRGNGCCRMLHVKHLAVTSAIYTLVSRNSNRTQILVNWYFELRKIELKFFFNYNFLIGVCLCRV